MMRSLPPLLLLGTLTACGPNAGDHSKEQPDLGNATAFPAWHKLDVPMVGDNVHHDTLLIQVTFDLGDGTFLMVAQRAEETKEGLRLYLYRPKADSSAQILASSKPGYDSMTMFPTFFSSGNAADGLVILANMGERQSWGQEAFWLKDQRFIHLGFLDLALREWRTEDEGSIPFRTSVAPAAMVSGKDGRFRIGFSGDSLQLYDDQQGKLEVMYPAQAVSYDCTADSIALVLNGRVIRPKAGG